MNEQTGKRAAPFTRIAGFALLVAAIAISWLCARSYIWPAYGRFGDAELARFYGTVAALILVPLLATLGQLLVCVGDKPRRYRNTGWILIGLTAAAMLVPLSFVGYSLRPTPTYDPQNYQHLIGQHLRDARLELDTKNSVSGSGGTKYSASYQFIYFRGMEILADRDGVITKVKGRLEYAR